MASKAQVELRTFNEGYVPLMCISKSWRWVSVHNTKPTEQVHMHGMQPNVRPLITPQRLWLVIFCEKDNLCFFPLLFGPEFAEQLLKEQTDRKPGHTVALLMRQPAIASLLAREWLFHTQQKLSNVSIHLKLCFWSADKCNSRLF